MQRIRSESIVVSSSSPFPKKCGTLPKWLFITIGTLKELFHHTHKMIEMYWNICTCAWCFYGQIKSLHKNNSWMSEVSLNSQFKIRNFNLGTCTIRNSLMTLIILSIMDLFPYEIWELFFKRTWKQFNFVPGIWMKLPDNGQNGNLDQFSSKFGTLEYFSNLEHFTNVNLYQSVQNCVDLTFVKLWKLLFLYLDDSYGWPASCNGFAHMADLCCK